MQDATFSLAITPSLPLPRPQLRVQIEDDTFDDFAVAIWKIHVAVPYRKYKVIPLCISIALLRHITEFPAHMCFVDARISNNL